MVNLTSPPSDNTITVIRQGAQYYLPIEIMIDEEVTSPDNVDDIQIQVGNLIKQYSDGSLEYNDGKWLFALRQDFTMSLLGSVKLQASIKRGDNVYPSDVYDIKVDTSIIRKYF